MIVSSRADFEKVRPIMKLVLFSFYNDSIVSSKKILNFNASLLEKSKVATTFQGGHVGGQKNKIFSRRMYVKS